MIMIKNQHEIDSMRKAGEIVYNTLNLVKDIIRPGITTEEIDRRADEFITQLGAKASFKGYYGFPCSLCISINEEVIHGIPNKKRRVREGDIVSIDCGAYIDGFHADAARTFPVGNISEEAKRLIDVVEKSFFFGIKKATIGNRVGDISSEIQNFVESNNFSIVKDYVGHGVGRNLHEEPQVPNFGKQGKGPKLVKGMALAIEPMVNAGDYRVKKLDNDWTVVSFDNSLSAHYENTIIIQEEKPLIITLF